MKKQKRNKWIVTVFLIIGAFIMLYPLIWMFSSSLKPEELIFKEPGILPRKITFENYINGWNSMQGIDFGLYFKNTLLLSVACIVGNVFTCSMTAYAFARLRFVGKNVLFGLLMVSMMLPMHAVLIPRFVMFTKLGWVNTYLPLIIPKFLATDGFFLLHDGAVYEGIPRELDQAAKIDGCGTIQIFLKIVMPLCKSPVVLTTALTLIWTWNDFFSQLIYIGNPKKFTVALGLRTFIDTTGASHYGALFAMSVLTLVPIILFFILAQKQLMEGMATQGMKG